MLRGILAGIFSFIFPGIGQIFNNQWMKGILLAFSELGILYFGIPNQWIKLLFQLIWLYAVIDAVIIAIRERKGLTKSKGLIGMKAIAAVGISIVLILRLVYVPYFLPYFIYNLAANHEKIIEKNLPEGQFEDEQEKNKQYLEEKYDETFIIGEGSYDSLFNHYVMDAHPEGDDELLFIVFQNKHDEFQDTYIRNIWTTDATNQFDPFINNLYENVWTYHLEVIVRSGHDTKILAENDAIPTFEESAGTYNESYHYSVMIYVIQNMNDENKQEELERMYEVITFFENNDIVANSYEIEYYDEEIMNHIDENTRPDVLEHSEYASFFLSLSQKDIKEITSPRDIEPHLVDLRD